MRMPKEYPDFWEKAFRGTITVLITIVVGMASFILKSSQEMAVELATIKAGMVTRYDLESLSTKVTQTEMRILTLELSCKKITSRL